MGNNYDEFATISYAVKNQSSLAIHTKHSFTKTEQNLFEIGLQEFGKDFVQIQKLVKTKTLEEICTYYYYWKTRYTQEFQKNLEENSPQVRLLRKNRAKLILESLKRQGIVDRLSEIFIDTDSDWTSHQLYPNILDPNGAYIHVKDKTHVRGDSRR